MLKEIYKLCVPWAIADKRQLLLNRCAGLLANYIYKIYSFISPIRVSDVVEEKTIITLTTYPGRIKQVYYCLNSLLRQETRPEKTILWLAESQFPNRYGSVPKRILNLRKYGLEICFCEDYRSYKKIIPTALEYKDHVIVTADDDALYPEDWFKKLVEKHREYPENVVCFRAHEMTLSDGRINPYAQWKGLSPWYEGPSMTLFPVGVGGVLYPANYFRGVQFDYERIKELAPTTDDVWLRVIGLKNKIDVVKVEKNSKEWFTVRGSQKSSLKSINVETSNANDIALSNLLTYYDVSLEGLFIAK